MATSTIADFVDVETPDYNVVLAVSAQVEVTEEGGFIEEVFDADSGDDADAQTVRMATDPQFFFTLQFPRKSAADLGTLWDWYFDPAKASGTSRSFKWTHPVDGETYVVKFADRLSRGVRAFDQGAGRVRLKVIGKAA